MAKKQLVQIHGNPNQSTIQKIIYITILIIFTKIGIEHIYQHTHIGMTFFIKSISLPSKLAYFPITRMITEICKSLLVIFLISKVVIILKTKTINNCFFSGNIYKIFSSIFWIHFFCICLYISRHYIPVGRLVTIPLFTIPITTILLYITFITSETYYYLQLTKPKSAEVAPSGIVGTKNNKSLNQHSFFKIMSTIIKSKTFIFSLSLVVTLAIILNMAIPKIGYNKVCKNSKEVIFEKVGPAKSIAFIPDEFLINNGMHQANFSCSMNVLDASSVEFIERPASFLKRLNNEYKYEKISNRFNLKQTKTKKDNNQSKFIRTLTTNITSQYVVSPKQIKLPILNRYGIYGNKIEIRRRSDSKVVAYTEYYWNNNSNKACPDEAFSKNYISNFIINALNANIKK